MKNALAYIIFSSCAFMSVGQEISLTSIFQMETSNYYNSSISKIYNDSIVYTLGSFTGNLEVGGTQLTTNYSKGIFLLKTTINNEFGWLKKIADNQLIVSIEPNFSLDIDINENVLIGIGYCDKLYFSSDSMLFYDGEYNNGVSLLKFDKNATLIWDKHFLSFGLGKNGVKVDQYNDVLLTGRRNNDCFITKFNSQGDSLWTKSGGSSSSGAPTSGGAITIDEQNNYYCSGSFTTSNSVYFDTEHPIFNPLDFGKYGSFLAKYDSNGNIQWLKCLFASSEQIQFAPITSVDVKNGNILVGGYFNSNFLRSSPNEGSIGTSNPYAQNRGFLIMYDSDGDRVWAKMTHTSANGQNEIGFVQFVEEGGFYATSSFTELMNIQGDPVSGGTFGNVLIEKYSFDGTPERYFVVEGQNRERLDEFFKIGNDFFLIGSTNSNSILFDGTSILLTTNPSFFIAKLHDNFVSLDENEQKIYSLFPNPTSGNVQIHSQNSLKGEEVRFYNTLGELVYQQLLNNQFSNELNLPEASGMYFIKVGEQTMKVVKE